MQILELHSEVGDLLPVEVPALGSAETAPDALLPGAPDPLVERFAQPSFARARERLQRVLSQFDLGLFSHNFSDSSTWSRGPFGGIRHHGGRTTEAILLECAAESLGDALAVHRALLLHHDEALVIQENDQILLGGKEPLRLPDIDPILRPPSGLRFTPVTISVRPSTAPR